MSPPRPILYDLTHLSHRAEVEAPTGIDRVDLMYARRFASSEWLTAAIHYGVRRPSILQPRELAKVVARAERRARPAPDGDPAFARVRDWILGGPARDAPPPDRPVWRSELVRRTRIGRYKLISRKEAPRDAIYLNIAQHALERASHFQWLRERADVKPVFFLHDLLPLDYPEFWPAGHEALFARKIDTLFALARGLITSSRAVADRIAHEYRRRGLAPPPLHAAALPSPLQSAAEREAPIDALFAAQPYFVVVGTIEPRKNHMMLLNLWRALVESGRRPPKLVLIGGRGWLHAETAATLDRCRALDGFVAQFSGLEDSGLRTIIRNARALLAPSFAEGYGLPVVEALELGAPVVASNLPVFREVSQGCATLIDPNDGAGWRDAVLAFSDAEAEVAREARARAKAYRRQDAEPYFAGVESFLADL